MVEVENLVKQILEGEVLDPAIVLQIKKLSKIAVKAIVDTTIQSLTNEELLMQLKRCKQKETQTDEQLVGYGRYLGPEVLAERAAFVGEKQFQAVWKSFLKLSPVLLAAPVSAKKPVKVSNYRREQAFAAAVKPFLKLGPEIFTIVISTTWVPRIASQKTRSGRRVKARMFLGDDECK